ncbi:MAG: hypothetical protein IJH07_05875 [Ruminococcus sp.]|nr:hypothetical protein [Ruminococcus sp.]
MTELEIIARAQMYLEKLANGVNPLTGEEVGETDVVNNVRISRCLFYSAGILKQIVDNKGRFKVQMPERKPFAITSEQLARFEYAEYGISITEIVKRINALIDTVHINELKSKAVLEWLVEAGLLTNIVVNNKTRRRPTAQGDSMGIFTEERSGQYGMYEGVFYSNKAQRFIIDNIGAIIAFENRE